MNEQKITKMIKSKNIIRRYTVLLFAMFLYACAYNLFLLPNTIVAGGVGGIAIITKPFIEPSIVILSINIILLTMSYILLGREKTAASLVGSLLYPLFVKLTSNIGDIIHINNNDLLLIVLFGGVLSGVAAGLVFKCGFTTGGTDILNQIISRYFKKSIGASMLLSDGIVVLLGGFFFGWTKVLYAIIVIYILSVITDKVILGISNSKAFYIVTDKEDEVKKYILENLSHGVTVIEAKGGFSGAKQHVLMCVVPTSNYFTLKEGIALIDKDAFFVVTDAYEVKGGA